jgi:hypothetical protein
LNFDDQRPTLGKFLQKTSLKIGEFKRTEANGFCRGTSLSMPAPLNLRRRTSSAPAPSRPRGYVKDPVVAGGHGGQTGQLPTTSILTVLYHRFVICLVPEEGYFKKVQFLVRGGRNFREFNLLVCDTGRPAKTKTKGFHMSKRIIFCADGTWDSTPDDTNVYKLFKAIPITAAQVAYYDDGVGSDGTPFEKLTGGAMGQGIFQKIMDGYTKIAHVYDPGDEIFIFGFSRGAYTARSLAGMIAICGLPAESVAPKLANDAFQAYRNPALRAAFAANYQLFDAKLTMVGVWDTVGALGIPAIVGGVDPVQDGFLDTNLHPDVLNAYQALSIDERRAEFPPTLWTPPNPPVAGQTLAQVWFAGVHCDVGGGYPETGLSDITFGWMLGKAQALGLQIDPGVAVQYGTIDAKNALGLLHNSWDVLWGFPKTRTVPARSTLSNSVVIRCKFENTYDPENITIDGSLDPAYPAVPVVSLPPNYATSDGGGA